MDDSSPVPRVSNRTRTTIEQTETEKECSSLLKFFSCAAASSVPPLVADGLLEVVEIKREGDENSEAQSLPSVLSVDSKNGQPPSLLVRLQREKHVAYLLKGLGELGPSYVCLDASRPWIIYWISHALDLLDALHTAPSETMQASGRSLRLRIIQSLSYCQNKSGGFGGGNQQFSHCAPTYAAVLALMSLGGVTPSTDETERCDDLVVREAAFSLIDRPALYRFFLSLKDENTGGFRMHEDGEIDIRGTYTVVAVAKLLNILTPQLAHKVPEFALACQTYEGGFGGEPGAEAHGGYVFCAVAALALLGEAHRIDMPALRRFLAARQLPYEGGFAGRTHKLVDGCYTFWQGGTCVLLEHLALDPTCDGYCRAKDATNTNVRFFNDEFLQRYTLMCAQQFDGGLRDKPSKSRDFYHTCYNLSGLSASQHLGRETVCWGSPSNLLAEVHPSFNIRATAAENALLYFASQPTGHDTLMGMGEDVAAP